MRRAIVALLCLAAVAGCDLIGPESGPELRTSYVYRYQGGHLALETSRRFVSVRLWDGVPSRDTELFFEGLGLEVERPPWNGWNLWILETDDAFRSARELWAADQIVQYAGPVFELGTCLGTLSLDVPANVITVDGDTSDPDIQRALRAAGARPGGQTRSGWRLFSLPWRDAGEWFDLANWLYDRPAIEWAAVSRRGAICPD
jgi:hypothetical protein